MNKQMMLVGGALVLILLVGGSFVLVSKNNKSAPSTLGNETTESPQEYQTPPTASSSDTMKKDASASSNSQTGSASKTQEFSLTGSNFKFSLNELHVKKGDTVKITFTNTEGFHDWVIDEFNAKTARIPAGKSETVQFVADKTGTFEYYCSVGQHRANGMKGNLIVE